MIVIKELDHFFKLQSSFKKIPHSQSKGWNSYLHQLNKNIIYFVDSVHDTKIACWGVEHKLPIIRKKILRISGECYRSNIVEKEILTFYDEIMDLEYDGIEIVSDSYYNINFEIGIKLAGYKRPMGTFSSNLSIEIDLEKKTNFDNNWKGNIRKGIKNQLYVTEIKDFNKSNLHEIFRMFDELSNSRSLNRHNRCALEALLLSRDFRTFMVYDKNKIPLAVNVIHINEPYASFVYAANSLELREKYGSHFIVNYVIKILKDEKFKFFDLCRIPVSKGNKKGIYLFKKGTRGNKILYNGEWCYYKNFFVEGMMFAYKVLIQKKERY